MTFSADGQWHLDKKVPIALIIMIVLQIAGGVWMASKLDSRVANLEKIDVAHERSIERLTLERDGIRDRLTRLEESQKASFEILKGLDVKLDRLNRP